MTATATRFPSRDELDQAVTSLATAFEQVEELRGAIGQIVKAWNEENVALDRPTFETIGMLADFVDSCEMELGPLRREVRKIDGYVHDLMLMRGNVELQDARAVAS